uniref:ATP synthase subunit a n=1 Tax=Bothromesostoma personatum TaxID=27905 RepID=A0A343VVI6_9PLAT
MNLDLFSALGLNNLIFLFPLFFFTYFIWLILVLLINTNNRFFVLNSNIIFLFFSNILSSISYKIQFSVYLISLFFLFLLYSNLWNLIPFTISFSSNITWTLLLGLFFWFLINFSSFFNNIFQYISHFTTLGSPFILVPFINIIEVISNVIRPLTLGVRLAVNLLTGHLLLSMFSNFHSSLLFSNYFLFFFVFFFGIFIFFYESCVSLVQAFVYGLMISQYFDEHSNN